MLTTSLARQCVARDLGSPLAGPTSTFSSWTAAVRRSVLSFTFDCDQPGAFAGAVRNRTLAGVNFVNMACERHAAYRDYSTITPEDAGYYVMTLQLSGRFRLTQDGRTAVLKPGQFLVYDSAKPAEVSASDDYTSTCIRFPKERLNTRSTHPLAEISATAFDCSPGLASTVWETLISVNRNLTALAEHGPTAVRNAMDMVSALLRTELGQSEVGRPGREAQLARIREYIDEHIGEPDLGPERIAAAHYISRRHLHNLFEHTEFTVGQWTRHRRVELCRHDLADPTLAGIALSAIAAHRGFASPSHFGQVFKRATGQTPAEYRHAASERWPRVVGRAARGSADRSARRLDVPG